jgi:arginine deiminase
MEDLFEFRSKFANSSKWSPALEESARVLHPFHSNENSYIQPLSKLFHPTNSGKKVTKFTFTHSEFLEYLQSWMQEVRHLTNDISHEVRKDAVAKAYVSDLINSIERNLNRNVNIKDDGTVILMHPTCHFDGEKM